MTPSENARPPVAPAPGPDLHQALDAIYQRYLVPNFSLAGAPLTPGDLQLQRTLEGQLIGSIGAPDRAAIASTARLSCGDFLSWFTSAVEASPAYDHPLFRFLSTEATLAEILEFVVEEQTIDGRFDDALALLQVGLPPIPKAEIADNYWDEMGAGGATPVHTDLFRSALADLRDAVGAPPSEPRCWQAKACGNVLLLGAVNPHLRAVGLGVIGAIEHAVPSRFRGIAARLDHLGAPATAVDYYRLHSQIDTGHADDWMSNVIAPTACAGGPEVQQAIALGLALRMSTSLDYCDALLSQLRRRRHDHREASHA